LELAVYTSIKSKDTQAFERNVAQLQPFYHDYAYVHVPLFVDLADRCTDWLHGLQIAAASIQSPIADLGP